VELWVVNGWQTFGEWHEVKSGGYLWNWRPREWLSLVNSAYAGQEVENDPQSFRLSSDNNLQARYYKGEPGHFLRSLAFSLVGDIGYEHRGQGAPAGSGPMGGVSLAHRFDWTERWKSTIRADFLYDKTQAISPRLPLGSPYALPLGPFLGGGLTTTLDFWPSPWLVTRLEYAHRIANQSIFSGPGGITGPNGELPTSAAAAASFSPSLRRSDDRIVLNVTLRL
jgi:hypothetical protein